MIMHDKLSFIVDLRISLPSVRDQGQRNTCTAFAVTACHEQYRATDEELSEEYIYSLSKHLEGKKDSNGISIPSAFNVISKMGHAKNELLPYDGSRDYPIEYIDISKHVVQDGMTRIHSDFALIDPDVDNIEKVLSMQKSVIAGLEVQSTFWEMKDGCFIDVPDEEAVVGLHAVLIVGYGIKEDGEKFFIIRNSWGTEWADEGNAYLTYEYFKKYNKISCIIKEGA